MGQIGRAILTLVGGISMTVATVAWFMIVVYMIKTVSHLAPGVGLWRDAPWLNPFNHILVTRNLSAEGLKYRRRLVIAVAAFLGPILLLFGISAVTGEFK